MRSENHLSLAREITRSHENQTNDEILVRQRPCEFVCPPSESGQSSRRSAQDRWHKTRKG
jgi:hypothetical protein